MLKKDLEEFVEEGKSIAELAEIFKKGKATVRYWLKKHNLKTKNLSFKNGYRPKNFRKYKTCLKCGEKDPNNFSGSKKSLCRRCHAEYTTNLRKKTRRKIIKLMGGKCVICGFNKYECSMDIHHINPEEKEKNFHRLKLLSWENIIRQVQGCVLLCRNCHGAVHYEGLKIDPDVNTKYTDNGA